MKCELCETDSSVLNWGLPCCVARYISKLKTLEQRRAWIVRIQHGMGSEFTDKVKDRLTKIFSGSETAA